MVRQSDKTEIEELKKVIEKLYTFIERPPEQSQTEIKNLDRALAYRDLADFWADDFEKDEISKASRSPESAQQFIGNWILSLELKLERVQFDDDSSLDGKIDYW